MARVVDPKRWELKRHFPAWLGVVAVMVILILFTAIGVGSVWFGEGGTGETRESPDSRYEASAMNMSRSTIRGRRGEWVEIRVKEKKTGRMVWHVKRPPPPGTAPDYGMRGVKFVEWAADSSAVAVDIGGGQKLTFPVPSGWGLHPPAPPSRGRGGVQPACHPVIAASGRVEDVGLSHARGEE